MRTFKKRMNKRRLTKRVLKTNKRTTRRNKRVLSIKTRGGENQIVFVNRYVTVTLETVKTVGWLQKGLKTRSIDVVSKISIHRIDNSKTKIYSIDCVYIINKDSTDLDIIKSVFSKIVFTILPSNSIDDIKTKIQSDIKVITANSTLDINKILGNCTQLPNSIELVITPNDDMLTITPIYQPNVCQVTPTKVKADERNMERGFMDLDYDNKRSNSIMSSIGVFLENEHENGFEPFLEKIRENMTNSEKEIMKEQIKKIEREKKLNNISNVTEEIKNQEYINLEGDNEDGNENENNKNEYLGPLPNVKENILDISLKRKKIREKMNTGNFTHNTLRPKDLYSLLSNN